MGARNKNRFMHRLSRPSPALIVAIIALIISMGGTGYAAFTLPSNSVGTKQLKNGSVTAAKVKRHSLTGAQINLKKLGTVPKARDRRPELGAPAERWRATYTRTPSSRRPSRCTWSAPPGQPAFDVEWTNVGARSSSRPASTRTRSGPSISRATCAGQTPVRTMP